MKTADSPRYHRSSFYGPVLKAGWGFQKTVCHPSQIPVPGDRALRTGVFFTNSQYFLEGEPQQLFLQYQSHIISWDELFWFLNADYLHLDGNDRVLAETLSTQEGGNPASLCACNCWVSSTASDIPTPTNTGADCHIKVILIWLLLKFHIPLGSTGPIFPNDLISYALMADSQAGNMQLLLQTSRSCCGSGKEMGVWYERGRAHRHAWVWAFDP